MDCSTPGFWVLHISWNLLKLLSIEALMPSSYLISHCPLFFLPSVFPSIRIFSIESARHIRWQSIGASASASVLPLDIQSWFPVELTGWSPCSPRDSQEFSPTPQFQSINSSVVNFLYIPTLPSVPGYWKSHSFDYMDLCLQSDVSAFFFFLFDLLFYLFFKFKFILIGGYAV